jgi:type II secretory pathway pseudopilin PulG
MKFAPRKNKLRGSRRGAQGFTLAEVLAAMLFMAIVIPVAVEGLRVASLAGEVANRKAQAARIAERVLNESLVSTNTTLSGWQGSVVEGTREFRYTLMVEPWDQHLTNQLPNRSISSAGRLAATQPEVNQSEANQVSMNLLSVQVFYEVQGREYEVSVSTLDEP